MYKETRNPNFVLIADAKTITQNHPLWDVVSFSSQKFIITCDLPPYIYPTNTAIEN